MNRDFSFGNYTEAEKEYWISKAEAVKTPFLWGDTFVAKQYDTVIALAFYLLFVLIICLSPVFSAEHEKGNAGILLSTKHGQRKLVYAKGFALPVQLLDSTICHSMNLGQFLLLQLLISIVICFLKSRLYYFCLR